MNPLRNTLFVLFIVAGCQSTTEVQHVNKIPAPLGLFSQNDDSDAKNESWFRDEAVLFASIQKLEPKQQVFEIQALRDTAITTDNGLIIHIPAGAFKYETGGKPQGKVWFKVSGFNSLSEFFAQRLSTRSADQLLETGGSVLIEAYADDRKLALTDTSQLVMMFPKFDVGDMLAFRGTRDRGEVMDWEVSEEDLKLKESESNQQDTLQSSTSASFGSRQWGNYIAVQDTIEKDAVTISITSYTSKTRANPVDWKYATEEKGLTMLLHETIKESGVIDSAILKSSSYRFDFEYGIGRNGKVTDFDVKSHSSYLALDSVIEAFFVNMPQLDPNLMGYLSPGDVFQMRIEGVRDFTVNTRLVPKEELLNRIKKFRAGAIASIDNAELNYYILNTAQIGWINCDRFLRPGRRMMNLAVKLPAETPTSAGIVFKSIRSYLAGVQRGQYVYFKNIPEGSQVTFIAMSAEDGLVRFGSSDLTVDGYPKSLATAEPHSLQEVEQAMNEIQFGG